MSSTINGSKTSAPAATNREIEDALSRIAGVHGARVVFDISGRISEVHVLASGDRTPKQIMRDVATTIQVGFGLTLDHRAVSVARLDAEVPPESIIAQAKPSARPAVEAVTATSHGNATEVRVQVHHQGHDTEGMARGPASAALKLAADAAVNARSELLGDNSVDVRTAELVKTADGQLVALVTLRAYSDRGEETWVGAAAMRKDPSDAIVRATFAAMNRTLSADQR